MRPGSFVPRPLRAEDLPPVLFRDPANDPTLRSAVRDRQLIRVAQGAYLPREAPHQDPFVRAREVMLARAVAAARRVRTGVAFSHATAAVLWGLPVVGDGRVHLTQWTRPCGGGAPLVVRHYRAPGTTEVTEVAGLPVTTLRRTVLDCVLHLGGGDAMVVADAGLRAGVDGSELRRDIARRPGARGVRRARAVTEAADDGAESAGESLARWVLLRAGFPAPTTQVRVDTPAGSFYADMGWERWRLLGEYDGAGKYASTVGDGTVLLREKRRQELVEDQGWTVVRIGAADLRDPEGLVGRVLRRVGPIHLEPRPHLS